MRLLLAEDEQALSRALVMILQKVVLKLILYMTGKAHLNL